MYKDVQKEDLDKQTLKKKNEVKERNNVKKCKEKAQ